MRKIFLLLLVLCVVSMSAFAQQRFGINTAEGVQIDYTNPKVFEVAEIKYTGLVVLDERAVTSYAGVKVGDRIPIPGREISEAIRKLWSQGIIADVQFWLTKTEGDRAFIEVKIVERPRILEFEIEGVSKTQQTEITDQLGIIGKVASAPLVKNTETLIKKYFEEKGFLNTVVKTSRTSDTLINDGVRLNFLVDKNEKVKINKIHFEGNDAFEDSRLKKPLKNTKERARFWLLAHAFDQAFKTTPKTATNYLTKADTVTKQELKEFINDNVKLNFLKSSKFIKADFEEDKESLITWYNSKGYRDADVISHRVEKIDDEYIDVHIEVEEGNKYYVRNIDWVGNYKYTDEFLTAKLGIKKGDVYNKERIEQRTLFDGQNGDDINSLYSDDGYLFFRLDVVEVRAENDSIDLEMRMSEGEQAIIKRIILKGNDRTSDHVVLREIRTLPGQKYSRKELIRTIRELGQLGYFDPEQINPQPIPNLADGTVDIMFDLVEKSSDQIQLSGGFGGPFGFVGTVGLSLNNFSIRNIDDFSKWRPYPAGDGQKLSLQIQSNGRRFQSYSLIFSEPWLGGRKPNNFTISLNRTANRSIDPITEDVFGFLKSSGVTVGLGRRLRWPDDYFQIQNSLTYNLYEVANFGQTLGFENGRSNILTFNTVVSRSNIDNPQFPRYGSQFTLAINATPPWSAFDREYYENPELDEEDRYRLVEYHKWMFDLSLFIPLNNKFVVNTRAHLGFIGTYTNATDSGPYERFFLGGNGLNGANNFVIGQDIIALRGYDDNSIVPVDPETGFRGGIVYNKFVTELRYPITLAPTSTIYVLGFAEAGNTWNQFSEYTPRKLFRSAGFGARIFLPAFGLLGVDWAYGFDSAREFGIEAGSQVHFTIGQQLR